MALQKEMILPSGAHGDYWKVTHIALDKVQMRLSIVLGLFENKEHSDQKYAPIVRKNFNVKIIKQDLEANITTVCYLIIRESNDCDLENALDV